VVLAASLLAAGTIAAGVVFWFGLERHPVWDMWGIILVVAVFATSTMTVARRRWWGRILALSCATFVVVGSAYAITKVGIRTPITGTLIAGLVLFGCLRGRAMFERYEGTAPRSLAWDAPRLGVVRWAIITNVSALMVDVVLLNALGSGKGLGLGGSPGFAATVLLTVALTVGLVTLALQKTFGLLLVAAATVALTALLASGAIAEVTPEDLLLLVFMFGPGLATAWASLVVWAKPILRFVRSR
jgi:hypothetical protein